jgi:hypothetical protein
MTVATGNTSGSAANPAPTGGGNPATPPGLPAPAGAGRAGSWSSAFSTIAPAVTFFRTIRTKTIEIWNIQGDLVGKTIVLLSLVIAGVALWPAIAGAKDGKEATLLAQWTAKKDFFELCESVSVSVVALP